MKKKYAAFYGFVRRFFKGAFLFAFSAFAIWCFMSFIALEWYLPPNSLIRFVIIFSFLVGVIHAITGDEE